MASIVGYCPVCGEPVIKSDACNATKKYCSKNCARRADYRRRQGLPISDEVSGRKPKKPKKPKKKSDPHAERLARLAQRDAEYDASPYAPKVTVETRNGVTIETRGTPCVSPRPCKW